MKIIKRNKFFVYFCGFLHYYLPKKNHSKKISELKNMLSTPQLDSVYKRVAYYCKKPAQGHNFSNKLFIKNLKKPQTPKAYYFDTYEYARYFDENTPIDFVFGDVTHIPDTPSIVKSRPISDNNQNSVLLNLDKARHFVWVKNDKPFSEKRNKLIGRGAIYGNQSNRIEFYKKYFAHPLCDLGTSNQFENTDWQKPKISLEEHLDYKFILSLQGNDVATNLKWIMSSNSIAVMPRPTMETWFMEGTLVGGKHYIEIKPDYSDLEEQLNFYINNPEKCEEIIKNAHKHCEQFFNKHTEDLCSLLVLEKYFGA